MSARSGAAAAANSTHLFVAGGVTSSTSQTYMSSVAIFSCASRQQVGTVTLDAPRGFLSGMTTDDGRLSLFAGGLNRQGFEATVDVLEHATNAWTSVNMTEPRRSPSIGGVGQFVVMAGGDGSSGTSRVVDVYDTTMRQMTQTLMLEAPRMNMGVALLGSQLIMAGGESRTDSAQPNTLDTVTDDVVMFSVSGGAVRMTQSIGVLSMARSRIAAATVGSNAVFVGGVSADLTPVAAIDVFDGASWSTVSDVGPVANAQKIRTSASVVSFVGIASVAPIAMRTIECRATTAPSTTAISDRAITETTTFTETTAFTSTSQSTTFRSSSDSIATTSSATTSSLFVASSPSTDASNSLPLIAGVVVGGIVLVAAIIIAIECALRRRRKRQTAAIQIRKKDRRQDPVHEIALQEQQAPEPELRQSLVRPSYLNAGDALDMPSFPMPSTDYGTLPNTETV